MDVYNSEFILSQVFWTAVSFAILLTVVWKVGLPKIIVALDERANKIREDLDEAANLRKDAQKMMRTYEEKIAASKDEAAEIVARSRKDADEIAAARTRDMDMHIKDKMAEAERKIQQAQNKAMEDMQKHVADMAMLAVEKIIGETVDDKKVSDLTEKMIKDLVH